LIIRFNNTGATAEFATAKEQEAYKQTQQEFSCLAPGAEYTYEFKKWRRSKGKVGWNGKVSLLKANQFPTGILPLVYNSLSKQGINIDISDDRPDPGIDQSFSPTVPLRDYQSKIMNDGFYNTYRGMWWPRGVFEIATGGGKTELAVAMYEYTRQPTLFLVHTKTLLHQTQERFLKYGVDAGILGDGYREIKPITVATIQTISSFLRNNNRTELAFLQEIKQVFFDEAHMLAASLAKGNEFFKVSGLLSNAYLRWGLTATPFMRDGYSNSILMGATGDILGKITNRELINQGYLCPAKIRMVSVPKVKCPRKWPDCYDAAVVLHTGRNYKIVEQIKKAPKPCLVMVKQIAHAEIIQRIARAEGMDIPILQGSSPSAERQKEIGGMRAGTRDTIICTTIFDEGVDIPELRSIVMAGGGKSKVKQFQRLGRGLRTAQGKDSVLIVDFMDTSTPTLKKHSEERLKVWKEQGFEIDEVK
jgi:superfamily II DNA or RNA helicase